MLFRFFKYVLVGFVIVAVLISILPRPIRDVALLYIAAVVGDTFDDPCKPYTVYDYVTPENRYLNPRRHRKSCEEKRPSPINEDTSNVFISNLHICPLHYMIHKQRPDVFVELLRAGGDPNQCENYPDALYDTLTGYCSQSRYRKVTEEFLSLFEKENIAHPPPQTLLQLSLENRCPVAVALAIKIGASVNEPIEPGRLPLHYLTGSASDSVIEIVKILVDSGADPNKVVGGVDSPYSEARSFLSDTGNWGKYERALLGNSKRN